jgi:REP-associated tyrosine transposase
MLAAPHRPARRSFATVLLRIHMGRRLRLEYPGAWWHITNRGVEKRDIFLDDEDRRAFLNLIADAVPEFVWRVHAYVLMNNHFHLLIETPEPTLSDGMKAIEEDYATAFNKKRARVGHLFQGRFKSHLVDSETYLLNVARYIVLNPVRANFARTAGEWPWSSYRATAGVASVPQWLTTTAVLDRFNPLNEKNARTEYCRFVSHVDAAVDRPWNQLVSGLCLGSAEFVARVQEWIDERKRSGEHPQMPRLITRRATLDEVRAAVVTVTGKGLEKSASRAARLAFAELARSEARAALKEIGAALGIRSSGVGYLVRQSKERQKTDRNFADLVERAKEQIRNCNLGA